MCKFSLLCLVILQFKRLILITQPVPGMNGHYNHDDAPENIRALNRENEAAKTLSEQFDVYQNPKGDFNGKNPDYLINGEIYDCYSPSSDKVRNIASNIDEFKIQSGQTSNVVINLDDSGVTLAEMSQQLKDFPIEGLDNAIGVKDGKIVNLFP